jgi:hypothetical protein
MYRMAMKTTYDLPESLVREINRIARERGIPARELVQQAITNIIVEDADVKPFVLRDMSVPGWPTTVFAEISFSDMVEVSYGDRA